MSSRVDLPPSGGTGDRTPLGLEACDIRPAGTPLLPFDFDLARLCPEKGSRGGVRGMAFGKCSSKILIIAAKCMPASTAKTEPFDHCVAVDLTSKPVTLSSVGPPPAPFQEHVSLLTQYEDKENV